MMKNWLHFLANVCYILCHCALNIFEIRVVCWTKRLQSFYLGTFIHSHFMDVAANGWTDQIMGRLINNESVYLQSDWFCLLTTFMNEHLWTSVSQALCHKNETNSFIHHERIPWTQNRKVETEYIASECLVYAHTDKYNMKTFKWLWWPLSWLPNQTVNKHGQGESFPNVKSKKHNHPLMTGCSTDPKPLLLQYFRWNIDQTLK